MTDPDEKYLEARFPLAGIDRSFGYDNQKTRKLATGQVASTAHLGVNVRGIDPATDRARGGSRSGLVKYINAQVAGVSFVVQELNSFTVTQKLGGPAVEVSLSGRVVLLVAVSRGSVYWAIPGATTWTAASNLTGEDPPLNFSGVMQSAPNNQKLYFVDGTNYVYFQPSDNTVRLWTPNTTVPLPVDSEGNKGRLICTWRGRTVISGLLKDPQNWFMSRVSDPHDFDYAPESPAADQAVAGNNSPMGLIGDVVTNLIPYSDDVLIFGGDSTIYMMRGDPMAGGQIDLVTDAIGMAWGQAWCRDPFGTVYFLSNMTGIYAMRPGQKPVRISQGIDRLLSAVDTGANIIRLLWDDLQQGMHVYITPAAAAGAATHYYYEARTGAWFQDVYANNDHNPLSCVVFDGNTATDRIPLIGCWDGYVRAIRSANTTDDGTNIASEVWFGPILTKDFDDVLFKDFQAVLGTASGSVTYEVYVGATAEAAVASSPVMTGTLSAARNLTAPIRRSGHALYVRFTSTSQWAMESIRIRVAQKSKPRRRGY